MSIAPTLEDIKGDLKAVIRANSDRGFVPYGGCDRICNWMMHTLDESQSAEDRGLTLDIHLFILVEIIKLISHADTSSGSVTDTVNECLRGVEALCQAASNTQRKPMFEAIIKTGKNKAFDGWEESAYRLLRSVVHLVDDQKQARKVYDLFTKLGPMYDDTEYPDRYVITLGMIERLEGAEAAKIYLTEHLHIKEIRMIAVERALDSKRYELAENLCLEALNKDKSYGRAADWAYYLERIYGEQSDRVKQIEIVRLIVKRGDKTYYRKLKELYQSEGTWEQRREPLLEELSKAYMTNEYAVLLEWENEWTRLLHVIETEPMYIAYFGKSLATHFPEETYRIYEKQIESEAAAATDRRKYKGVCKLIKEYAAVGANAEVKRLVKRLIDEYPRRPAMIDELTALERRLK